MIVRSEVEQVARQSRFRWPAILGPHTRTDLVRVLVDW